MLPQSEAGNFAYTACYCEENVYKLCEHGAANIVVWDYHVFVVQKVPEGAALVWDLDT